MQSFTEDRAPNDTLLIGIVGTEYDEFTDVREIVSMLNDLGKAGGLQHGSRLVDASCQSGKEFLAATEIEATPTLMI